MYAQILGYYSEYISDNFGFKNMKHAERVDTMILSATLPAL
jgi:hypothetical protein